MPTLRYIISNGATAGLVYFSYFKNDQGAMNILTFLLWAMLISSIFGANKTVINEVSKTYKRSIVPKWFDHLFDLSLIIVFAYFGSFVFASIYLIHVSFTHYIFSEVEKIQNERDNTTSENA